MQKYLVFLNFSNCEAHCRSVMKVALVGRHVPFLKRTNRLCSSQINVAQREIQMRKITALTVALAFFATSSLPALAAPSFNDTVNSYELSAAKKKAKKKAAPKKKKTSEVGTIDLSAAKKKAVKKKAPKKKMSEIGAVDFSAAKKKAAKKKAAPKKKTSEIVYRIAA